MKTDLFSSAIYNRYRIRFLYGLEEVVIDPYYITSDSTGKVLYGKSSCSNEIKKFEYKRITNIKIIHTTKFSPVIPIIN